MEKECGGWMRSLVCCSGGGGGECLLHGGHQACRAAGHRVWHACGLLLDGQVELELCWQLVLRVQPVREVHSPYAAVRMNLDNTFSILLLIASDFAPYSHFISFWLSWDYTLLSKIYIL